MQSSIPLQIESRRPLQRMSESGIKVGSEAEKMEETDACYTGNRTVRKGGSPRVRPVKNVIASHLRTSGVADDCRAPFQVFDRRDQPWFQPTAPLHLGGSQSLASLTAARPPENHLVYFVSATTSSGIRKSAPPPVCDFSIFESQNGCFSGPAPLGWCDCREEQRT
jgi:hypothetical protein